MNIAHSDQSNVWKSLCHLDVWNPLYIAFFQVWDFINLNNVHFIRNKYICINLFYFLQFGGNVTTFAVFILKESDAFKSPACSNSISTSELYLESNKCLLCKHKHRIHVQDKPNQCKSFQSQFIEATLARSLDLVNLFSQKEKLTALTKASTSLINDLKPFFLTS